MLILCATRISEIVTIRPLVRGLIDGPDSSKGLHPCRLAVLDGCNNGFA
jgi:hypothetical protein